MSKIAGFEVGDMVLIAALGITAYFAYTTVIKPVSNVTNAASDLITLKNVPSSSEVAYNVLFGVPDYLVDQSKDFWERVF